MFPTRALSLSRAVRAVAAAASSAITHRSAVPLLARSLTTRPVLASAQAAAAAASKESDSSSSATDTNAPTPTFRPSTSTPSPHRHPNPSGGKMSIKFSLSDDPGSLQEALGYFARHKVNLTRLESRPSKRVSNEYDFYIDFLGSPDNPNVRAMLAELRATATGVSILESRKVPWFPRRAKELDLVASQILDAGAELQSDHPGFNDPVYRARREELAQNAQNYRHGAPIPRINYSEDETRTWGVIYDRLMPLVNKYGCAEHVRLMPLLQENCGYARDNIPQLQDISDFLKDSTGFTIRPVAGLLSARNFLYGLAFRTFFSTQYLRHHSRPLYTPEPDLVHELMGHAPLFADQSFADFSQEIGLASIGATDDQILKLARCYWFTVEFGLCLAEDGVTRKAYGAGLLSSFGELEYSMGLSKPKSEGGDGQPEYREWDPFDAGERTYPITTYQSLYYVAKSFSDAKRSMQEFSNSFARPFGVRYNPFTQALDVDANIDLIQPAAKQKWK